MEPSQVKETRTTCNGLKQNTRFVAGTIVRTRINKFILSICTLKFILHVGLSDYLDRRGRVKFNKRLSYSKQLNRFRFRCGCGQALTHSWFASSISMPQHSINASSHAYINVFQYASSWNFFIIIPNATKTSFYDASWFSAWSQGKLTSNTNSNND